MDLLIKQLQQRKADIVSRGDAACLKGIVNQYLDTTTEHHFELSWLREMTHWPAYDLYAKQQISGQQFALSLHDNGMDFTLAKTLVGICDKVLFDQSTNNTSNPFVFDYPLHSPAMHHNIQLIPVGLRLTEHGFRGSPILFDEKDVDHIQLVHDGKALEGWHIPHRNQVLSVIDKLTFNVDKIFCCQGWWSPKLVIVDVENHTVVCADSTKAALLPALRLT